MVPSPTPKTYRLATIHPLQTDRRTNEQTDDNRAKDAYSIDVARQRVKSAKIHKFPIDMDLPL